MKQLTTILFFTIALFYLGGYRLLTSYLQSRADKDLEVCLDKRQYNEADLVSIKTPLNLPYYSSSDFERVSGELSVKGVIYKYVKRRIYNDTLEVLCIRDKERTSIQLAKDEFYKQSNGLATHTKKPVSSGNSKPLFFEYCNYLNHFSFNIQSSEGMKHLIICFIGTGINTGRLIEQPPEA